MLIIKLYDLLSKHVLCSRIQIYLIVRISTTVNNIAQCVLVVTDRNDDSPNGFLSDDIFFLT